MHSNIHQKLGWRHEIWGLVRFFRAIGRNNKKLQTEWLKGLKDDSMFNVLSKEKGSKSNINHGSLPIEKDVVELFFDYLDWSDSRFSELEQSLRTEEEALSFCESLSANVKTTSTKNKDHHQSSKAVIAAVNTIASKVCSLKELSFDDDPQNRCIWLKNNKMHVTARNLDGAIPGLVNPSLIWEIKEYWGKTSGGSKMSDAVYECQLVGRELREFEEESSTHIHHVVFLDGKDQWGARKSDLLRFLDLESQGLIDYLFVGREIENEWEPVLEGAL